MTAMPSEDGSTRSASVAHDPHDPSAVPAEWWERMAARIIDAVPFVVLYYILFAVFSALFGPADVIAAAAVDGARAHTSLPRLIAWLISGAAFAVYDVVLHSRYGRTLGKHVLRIRLIPAGGGVLTTAALAKRAAMLPGPMAAMDIAVLNLLAGVFLFVVGLFILVDKPSQQGLHDKVAGTMVVRRPR
ncbi:RDD family protein [Spongiactinospora sp. 9N601]|uniref:RDD family protein n=1 Tax=Spongiactinospora sp. 9N601 TaxID=3375149 RepID=UPI00378A7284